MAEMAKRLAGGKICQETIIFMIFILEITKKIELRKDKMTLFDVANEIKVIFITFF